MRITNTKIHFLFELLALKSPGILRRSLLYGYGAVCILALPGSLTSLYKRLTAPGEITTSLSPCRSFHNPSPPDSTWVMEIESALQKGKNIVPMYFDGVSEIKQDDLPSRIRSLSLENAVLYSHPYSDASFDRLASRLPKDSLTLPGWSKWLFGGLVASGLAVGGYSRASCTSELEGYFLINDSYPLISSRSIR